MKNLTLRVSRVKIFAVMKEAFIYKNKWVIAKVLGVILLMVLSLSAQEVEWQRTYGGSDNDYSNSVQQTQDGGYIIAGEIWFNSPKSYLFRKKPTQPYCTNCPNYNVCFNGCKAFSIALFNDIKQPFNYCKPVQEKLSNKLSFSD